MPLLFFWLIPTLAGAAGTMLPQVDDGEGDIGGWWMSEKLDGVRDNLPPVGMVVTFKHYGYHQPGLPKFPFFLRIRTEQGC